MPITRRNLLQGIAAGTAIAAGTRPVAVFADAELPPLPGVPPLGPTLLNRNENAYGPSEKVLAVIREAATSSNRYPRGEYDALRAMLAELHKVKPEQIVLGVGSSEILRLAGAAFLSPKKKTPRAQSHLSFTWQLCRSERRANRENSSHADVRTRYRSHARKGRFLDRTGLYLQSQQSHRQSDAAEKIGVSHQQASFGGHDSD